MSEGPRGWLVVNRFYQTEKFTEQNQWFIDAAQDVGITLEIRENSELAPVSTFPRFMLPDFVICWDKDVKLARQLELAGVPVFNSADSIRVADSKTLTALALEAAGVPQPKYLTVPFRYRPQTAVIWEHTSFPYDAEGYLGLPIVAKEDYGSFGEQVSLLHSGDELVVWLEQLGATDGQLQEFVSTSAGRDLRLQVVGDEVVAAMERHTGSAGDFRANLTTGGSAVPHTPTEEERQCAVAAARAVGCDFAGVDLLFGAEGPLVCEVNSNAHFVNLAHVTGINVAPAILTWIRRHLG
ncbi:MAG: RimK family alpha-L-glutamate ligase [Corynebacterium sp.]|nr:RimK family alpha-L-glutamate ligase [Corynebacterium sp.]